MRILKLDTELLYVTTILHLLLILWDLFMVFMSLLLLKSSYIELECMN
jgi:hypothetical protein